MTPNKKIMKNYCKILSLLAVLAIVGCQGEKFHVNGHITEAADTTLYLEHITLADGVQVIDSVRLTQDGSFSLSGKQMPSPEFYRLRIGGQCINLAIDSTETVSVEASLKNMSFGYSVEGSGTCDTIRILSLKLADLERNIVNMMNNKDYTLADRDSFIQRMITDYKTDIKLNFIQNHYEATASYFACFQMIGGALLFDPIRDKSDLTWLRAVANAWNERYPGQTRTENLTNIAAEGRRNQVKPRQIVLNLDSEKINELGIIDMTMPDINGRECTLSDLKGKVVLLDFTALSLPNTQERIIQLREIYNKYHSRGFEVYQVSLDPDRHFWAQHCDELPWISVYCEEGFNSDIVSLYQVNALPTYFLIDRNCDLQARQEDIPDLSQAIEKLL